MNEKDDVNILDLVFGVLIISFTLMSFMRGGLKEILSLIGLAIGFFSATAFYPDLADQVEVVLPDRALSELGAFLLILVFGYFLGVILTGLSEALNTRHNELWNRVLGAMIGLCKGLLASLVLFWVIDSYIPGFQGALAGSLLAEELARLMALINA